eukprot:XP_011670036.1 PREDICTED: SCAN domain-containing protein 3-like [Strongylocentrotus purpuratus]
MFPDSAIAKKYGCGRTKTGCITNTLGKDSRKKIVDVIKVSPFSLATDGSTDYDDVKLYPICVRYFDPDEGRTLSVLLSLKECNKPSTGENIFKLLEAELQELEIPFENLVSFSADNASVMLGKFKGVAAFLLKRAPSMYISGCPCHLMHLAAEKAAKRLPVRVEDLLIDIYYHLEKSSKRKQEFKSFQAKENLPQHKIIKHVSTRWLSLGQCITRLLEQWDAILPFFEGERKKTSGTKRQRVTQEGEQERKKQKNKSAESPLSSATSTKQGTSVTPAVKPGSSHGPTRSTLQGTTYATSSTCYKIPKKKLPVASSSTCNQSTTKSGTSNVGGKSTASSSPSTSTVKGTSSSTSNQCAAKSGTSSGPAKGVEIHES